MNRTRFMLTTVGLFSLTLSAHAQPPGYTPPNSSPWFNLLKRDSATSNYYTGVRPQQQAQAAFQNIQQQFDAYGRAAAAASREELTAEGIRPTGRGATFMNLGHYYPARTGRAGTVLAGRR